MQTSAILAVGVARIQRARIVVRASLRCANTQARIARTIGHARVICVAITAACRDVNAFALQALVVRARILVVTLVVAVAVVAAIGHHNVLAST